MRSSLTALLALAALAACRSQPAVTEVPDIGAHFPAERVAAAGGEADTLVVEPLDADGVRGGSIVYTLPGTPEDVLAMLLDFDDATGRRVWAKEYSIVERNDTRVVAHWVFEGRMGVHPKCDLVFKRGEKTPEGMLELSFKLLEPTFGLAAFFGDHLLTKSPTGGTLVRSRVYIDSGLPLVNATAEDIESGLREDAEAMRAWMKERLE